MLTVCTYTHKNNNLKQLVNHQYDTRNKNNLHIQIPVNYKNVNKRFINYLAPKFYNLLPLNIRNINNIKKFNATSKSYIKENYHLFIGFLV